MVESQWNSSFLLRSTLIGGHQREIVVTDIQRRYWFSIVDKLQNGCFIMSWENMPDETVITLLTAITNFVGK